MRVVPATILLLENRVGCKKGIPTAMAIRQNDCLSSLQRDRTICGLFCSCGKGEVRPLAQRCQQGGASTRAGKSCYQVPGEEQRGNGE